MTASIHTTCFYFLPWGQHISPTQGHISYCQTQREGKAKLLIRETEIVVAQQIQRKMTRFMRQVLTIFITNRAISKEQSALLQQILLFASNTNINLMYWKIISWVLEQDYSCVKQSWQHRNFFFFFFDSLIYSKNRYEIIEKYESQLCYYMNIVYLLHGTIFSCFLNSDIKN